MTLDEFDRAIPLSLDYRYELIGGLLVVTRLPSVAEFDPNEELGHLLRTYRDTHPQGSSLDATLPERYVFGPNRRRADRLIWAGLGRVPDIEKDRPAIVVEFVSRGKKDFLRDYEEKKAEYLGLGIPEYWIIDRFRRVMTVYRNPPTTPAEQVIDEKGTYQTPLLPGFVLPLGRLLTVADRWRRSGSRRKPKP